MRPTLRCWCAKNKFPANIYKRVWRRLLTNGVSCCVSFWEMSKSPSNNMEAFRRLIKAAKRVVVLTGAGVSAESGVPTFRGAGGYWRTYSATDLATPMAFKSNPSLVWEFYHHRRENMISTFPNNAHKALAEFEERLKNEGRHVCIITQNIDELHRRAGSQNIIELHGSLFRTRCLKCKKIESNYDSPICEALRERGSPDPKAIGNRIPKSQLPKCKSDSCGGLLRPDIVWFHENLDTKILEQAGQELIACDMCLVVGTSSVVYPAAMFAPQVAARGVPVGEFNVEATAATETFGFQFLGPCGETLPIALAP